MVKIFIDAGHGGNDPGACTNGLKEKDLTLKIAKKIRDKLANYQNVQVKLSREDDQTLSLTQRTNMANAWGADYLISVHINAGGGTGFESYTYNKSYAGKQETNRKRSILHAEIMRQLNGVRDRGMKEANLHMVRESKMESVLTENLFIDNANDAALLKQDSWLDKIAQGHVNGLAIIFGLKQKTQSQPAPQHTASPIQTTGNIGVGSIVTVAAHATHYQTGQPIASFVKGNRYKVIQVKDVNQSNSKKAYLLDGIMSWVLEQDIVEAGGQAVAPQAAKKRYIVLPANAATWTVYKLDRPPVKANKANIAGTLRPSKFGGLEYEILEDLGGWVFKIKTGDFGTVKIYGAPSTGARIVEK